MDSWSDPSHLFHFSSRWFEPFVVPENLYLEGTLFELVSNEVVFGRSLRTKLAKLLVKIIGLRRWEKHYAWIYPARYIRTVLSVKKTA